MSYFSAQSLVKTSGEKKENRNLALVNRQVRSQLPGFSKNPA